jgi:hypothetical protein
MWVPMLSPAAFSGVVGKDVFVDITYCLQEWQEAGKSAITYLPDPKDDHSWGDWVISLIGNLAWAATVFFPAEGLLVDAMLPTTSIRGGIKVTQYIKTKLPSASASAATKAFSLGGAILGANTVGAIRGVTKNGMTSPDGKQVLHEFLGGQVPNLQKAFAEVADNWTQTDLLNHLVAMWSIRARPTPGRNYDAEFISYCNSVVGAQERRKTVWEQLVFRNVLGLDYDNGQVGLEHYLAGQLKPMLQDFDRQWGVYSSRAISEGDPLPESSDMDFVGRGVNFDNVKAWMDQHPFEPKFQFKDVPFNVSAIQENNRRNLAKRLKAQL